MQLLTGLNHLLLLTSWLVGKNITHTLFMIFFDRSGNISKTGVGIPKSTGLARHGTLAPAGDEKFSHFLYAS